MKINPKGRKLHDTNLRKKFGIGLIQYETMLQEQDGLCYLCGVKYSRNLAVDHNHQTGKVRRLLCSMCNQALGLFKDNRDVLLRAADYVVQTFEPPPDGEVETVPHNQRARWRGVVTTPIGTFGSFMDAAAQYNVDPTTVAAWCGAYDYRKHLQREGFSFEKVFK